MKHAFENNDDQILSGLQAVGGDQDAPSPDGAASQGALGAPAPAGDSSGPELAAGQTYFDIWNEGSDEDRMETLDAMEEQMGAQNSGVIAKVNEIASQAMEQKDGKTLNLLLKWGWKPDGERPAFDAGAQ